MKRHDADIHAQLTERWPDIEEDSRNELFQCFERIANAYGIPPSRLRLTDHFLDLSKALDCGGFSDGEDEVEAILDEKGLPNLSASDQVETLLQAIVDASRCRAHNERSQMESGDKGAASN